MTGDPVPPGPSGSPSASPLPPAAEGAAGQVELRRLHPLTPLVRGAKVFGGLAAIGLYQAYQTVQQVGVLPSLAGVGLLVIGAFVVSWLSWRFTGYRITDRELQIQEGILARRHRTVPLERVQAIDVVQPLLARLLGLAEVRLEVVGQDETEAPLAYLTVAEAEAVRNRLLALVASAEPVAARTAESAANAGPAAARTVPAGSDRGAPLVAAVPRDERHLFTVDRRTLILSQILTPNTLSLPFLAIYPVMALGYEGLSFAAVFGFVSAIVGLAQLPVRRILNEYGFTVSDTAQGLRLRHGMLETRTQTVAPGRIQAVRIRRPLLWRPFGWVRVEIAVAGYSGGGSQERRTGALVPVADAHIAYAVIRHVLPELPEDLDLVPMTPAPRRARWLAPLQYKRLAAAAAERYFISRSGWLTEQHDIAIHARVQSIRFTQGPLQRRLDLASVHTDLAGDHGPVTGRDLATADALRFLTDLVALARANRRPADAEPRA